MIKQLSVIILVLLIPMMAIGSYAASPLGTSSSVQAYQFPGINVVASPNTSYNLSYMYLIVKSGNGIESSPFDQDNWSVSDYDNESVTYTANLTLNSGANFGVIPSIGVENSQVLPENSINHTYSAKVVVKVSKMTDDNSTLILDHGGSTINSLGNSTMSIMISIYFSKEIPGSGEVYLIQSLQGTNKNYNSVAYGNFSGDYNCLCSQEVNGFMANTHPGSSSLSHDALYWWNDSYLQDGVPMTMKSLTFNESNSGYVVFEYSFSNGVSSISQDPYISVPGMNIFQNPIIQEHINSAINYLVVHSEYLGAGLSGGLLLLGFSYVNYRRKKL